MDSMASLFFFSIIVVGITLLARSRQKLKNILQGIVVIVLGGYFYSLPFIPARLPGLADLNDPYKLIACFVMILCGIFLIVSPPKARKSTG